VCLYNAVVVCDELKLIVCHQLDVCDVLGAFNAFALFCLVRFDVKMGGVSNMEEYTYHTRLKIYPRFKNIMIVLVSLRLQSLVQKFLIVLIGI
jgi:hypothetical protein